ncbi:MAG: hypothetical protein AAF399_21075 [Bacteroidota bacterium]
MSPPPRPFYKSSWFTLLIIAVGLIGGYFIWGIWTFTQKTESIAENIRKASKEHAEKKDARETAFLYDRILGDGQGGVFVGRAQSNDTTKVYALQFQALDSVSIRYRIERLISWQPLPDLNGIATLDSLSLEKERETIQFKDGTLFSAFRFVDQDKECPLEIYLSKGMFKKIHAMAREICETDTIELTPKLWYK